MSDDPDDRFDPDLARRIDLQLGNMATGLSIILRLAEQLISKIEKEHAFHQDFPLSANLTRFENQFRFLFNDKVMRLDKEVEALRKDWQIKTMEFDQEKGEWSSRLSLSLAQPSGDVVERIGVVLNNHEVYRTLPTSTVDLEAKLSDLTTALAHLLAHGGKESVAWEALKEMDQGELKMFIRNQMADRFGSVSDEGVDHVYSLMLGTVRALATQKEG